MKKLFTHFNCLDVEGSSYKELVVNIGSMDEAIRKINASVAILEKDRNTNDITISLLTNERMAIAWNRLTLIEAVGGYPFYSK